jgi:hypothetical protein
MHAAADPTAAIEEVIRAVSLRGTGRIEWYGRVAYALPRTGPAWSPALVREYLVGALAELLYDRFYTRGRPTAGIEAELDDAPRLAADTFTEALRQACRGRGRPDPGWVVRGRSSQAVLVLVKDGLEIRAPADRCVARGGEPVAVGATVALHQSSCSLTAAPGFVVVNGDTPMPDDFWAGALRVYWNLRPQGAIRLVEGLTTDLNRAAIPYQLKVLARLARTARADASVLYLRRADYDRARASLETTYARLADFVRVPTPSFTRALAAGLGLAEAPRGGVSFGMHRCTLVAEGLIDAHERRLHRVTTRLGAVRDRFRQAGLDLDRPYLEPDSANDYPFSPPPQVPPPSSRADRRTGGEIGDARAADGRLLDAAERIGRYLCDTAVWHGRRCNWVGYAEPGRPGSDYHSLGPEPYAGSSGVGLFLAELARLTALPRIRETALAALRQALDGAHTVAPGYRAGFHAGWAGISASAARAGVVLREPELVERGVDLLERASDAWPLDGRLDLLSGCAGLLVALTTLHAVIDRPWVLDRARRSADGILARSEPVADGHAWPTTNAAGEACLTGFAHGSTGIAYALLSLVTVTGDARYRAAVEAAWRYERSWLVRTGGAWPDLRGVAARRPLTATPPRAGHSWCHGAPGAAVSRLLAHAILGDEALRAEAMAVLASMRPSLDIRTWPEAAEATLCHGLVGNADIVLTAGRQLGPAGAALVDAALRVARLGVEAGGPRDAGGLAAATPPGLMLGWSGLGLFYLRCLDPTIPSPLAPGDPSSSHLRPNAP